MQTHGSRLVNFKNISRQGSGSNLFLEGPSSHNDPLHCDHRYYAQVAERSDSCRGQRHESPEEAATSAAVNPDKPPSSHHDGDIPAPSRQYTLTTVRGERRAARGSWLCPAQL